MCTPSSMCLQRSLSRRRSSGSKVADPMRSKRQRRIDDLRRAIDCLPERTKLAMLEGIDANTIIVGAYTDRRGGVCPMLAAHRHGGRTEPARVRARLGPLLRAPSARGRRPSASSSCCKRAPRGQPVRRTSAASSAPRSPTTRPRRATRREREARGARPRLDRRDASAPAEPSRARARARLAAREQPAAGLLEDDLRHDAAGREASAGSARDSAMSSVRIIVSAGTWPLTKSVIGVSTKPGHERAAT